MTVVLSDLCELIVDSEHKTAPVVDSGHPMIRTPNIGEGRFLLDGVRRVDEQTYAVWTRRAVPQEGDLILAREAPVGNVAMIPPGMRPILGQRTVLIRPDRAKVEPAYLQYLMLGREVQHRMLSLANGATVPHLNMKDIRELEIPDLPELQDQRKVAAVLAAYDELIENNLRRIEILEEMAQAVYREWFVNFRFPGHEKVGLVESPLGPIPEGWQPATVEDAIELNPRVRLPRDEELRFVPMGSLMEGSMVIEGYETRIGPSGSQFRNGDTLLARITPSLENGKTGFVQFLSEGEVACGSTEFIVMRSRTLTPEYVYLFARTDDFRAVAVKSMVGASGRQRVQESSISKYLFAHPDSTTLQRFHDVVSPMFRLVQNLVDQNANLRATRDLLLPKLVSGEIDVSDLDIDTEWLAS